MTLPYPRLTPFGAFVVLALVGANVWAGMNAFGPHPDPFFSADTYRGWEISAGAFQAAFRAREIPWPQVPDLISHGFAHSGAPHLAFNMVPLAVLGWLTARRIGGLGLLAAYLGLMVLAVLTYVAVASPYASMLGASGAVHGLGGLWLVWAWADRRPGVWRGLPSLLWLAFILAVHVQIYRVMGLGFAWQLHIAGLLAGMALAPLIPAREQIAGATITGAQIRAAP